MATTKKLSLKVFTEQKPAKGSYEPALSPKTAPDSFAHPEDAFDLETYIGQVAPAFTLPKTIELDAINEATSGQGVVIDGVLLKDNYAKISEVKASDSTANVIYGSSEISSNVNGGTMQRIGTTGVRSTHVIVSGVTAFAGGGQTNATVINGEYNFIATVATTSDSVKLAPAWQFYSRYVIKNEGVNSVNIFPPVGGNLGAGVDTAVALAAGNTAEFVAINSTTVFKQVS